MPVLLGASRLAYRGGGYDLIGPGVIVTGLSIWCVAATFASAVVSRVIYGLISQVREVMQLGQYRVGERIGEGGMGTVYRAEHAMLRRPTAIKLLLPGRVSAEALARFEREVQLTSRLSHPNTVAIYDYGRTSDGVFYYAMEYLDGISLEMLVAEDGPQPDGRIVHVLSQVAGALAEAHSVGLIHRDIKPANIMLCERGGMPDVAKVVDFGLVKKIDGGSDQVTLTTTDTLAGTPLYMAPESITRPDQIDGRADLYALGAVGYFLATGVPPFMGRSVVEICGHHLHTEPDRPSLRLGRPMTAKLEGILLACLAKAPENRPRDAQELLTLLAECEGETRWSNAQAKDWWLGWRARSKRAPEQAGPVYAASASRDVA
jgi:serine/threonine protein kinase